MKQQVFNPFLPSYEYIPDGEPYVFDGRVYVYGSHDRFNGDVFCQNDYVCWSAPEDNLADWRYEGVIYKKEQDPHNQDGKRCLYAPDAQKGVDGRYYLYYALDNLGIMSVAVCNTPAGKYEYYGDVHYRNGKVAGGRGDIYQFDPGIFIDDDKRIFLFSGFAPQSSPQTDERLGYRKYEGAYCMELEEDMLTIKAGPNRILPKAGLENDLSDYGDGYKGHEFFEASSMRKINGQYYFIYSSVQSHELCYAVSQRPDGDFKYGGTIISNGDVNLNGRTKKNSANYIGNNHGSLVKVKDQWYIFYHRQTNRHCYSRQACAEKVFIEQNGKIPQVEITSCGLNNGPLEGKGRYEAYIACNLYSKNGTGFYSNQKEIYAGHPCFTQEGPDRECDASQYISNIQDGTTVGFKYFMLNDSVQIGIEVRGNARGIVSVLDGEGKDAKLLTEIAIEADENYTTFWGKKAIENKNSKMALFFKFTGDGYLDFKAFELVQV